MPVREVLRSVNVGVYRNPERLQILQVCSIAATVCTLITQLLHFVNRHGLLIVVVDLPSCERS